MHELSIAQSIVDAVNLEADKHKAKQVKEINIEVGELMQLDTNALSESLELLINNDSRLKKSEVFVHVQSALFYCNKCGSEWDMKVVREQLKQVSDSLLVREPDSKELPLHFLPSLLPSFVHCPKCGSADSAAVAGDNIKLRKLVME